ncbi:hypothetical protein ACJJTC_016608 [Scirpophaga incertulas]
MWTRLLVAITLAACACAQTTNTKVQHGGASFAWGWQQQPDGSATVGQYYIQIPQAEQLVRYAADGSGYHGALAQNSSDAAGRNTHSVSLAPGQRALELHTQTPAQQYEDPIDPNTTNTQLQQPLTTTNSLAATPVEIFLLQQQYQTPVDNGEFFHAQSSTIPDNLIQYNTAPYLYLTNNRPGPLFNTNQQQPTQSYQRVNNKLNNTEITNPVLKGEPPNQNHEVLTSSVVKVFKNLNCTTDHTSNTVPTGNFNEENRSNRLRIEHANIEAQNINGNFGAKYVTTRPLSYRGAVHFRVEPPRENSRSERYYFTTIATPIHNNKDPTEEGINRLVKSTQDLISNEDLLKINHAAEKNAQITNDDLIKPRAKFSLKGEQSRYGVFNNPRNRFTVRAKFSKIVEGDTEQSEINKKEQASQRSSNEYRFITPIVVAEPNVINFKEQIVNNLVSTMVPYIEDGYEIIRVSNSELANFNNNDQKQSVNSEKVGVTPRPIGQKYLAPITVALRLLNANDTKTLNTVEDHETSDTEFIPEKVKRPQEKTVVEIQESIPISITHINDVEVGEYLDEGRSNKKDGPYDVAKSLYNKYVKAFESSNKLHNNVEVEEMRHKYDKIDNQDRENDGKNYIEDDASKDNIITSENKLSSVQLSQDADFSAEKSEHISYYSNHVEDNQQLIQPIIIEKEIPITKFVDRFIEKQVPYPERVEIIKAVPVDRPVPYPVPYEKIVDRPVEVTRFVDKPYPIEIHHAFPVQVKVPYPVEQKVFVDRPIHIPFPVEKVVEKQVVQTIPVPTPVAVPVEVPVEQKVLYPVPIETPVPYPVEVEKPVPVERIVEKEIPVPYPVEKRVPYPVPYETKVPVPYPVEKKVPVTVEKIVEKPVTVTKVVEKPVHIEVPVPQPVPVPVHVREPYPVDRIVEKKVPYPVHVDRIVEKKVPIKVPYPVQTVVEKIVEKPVVVTKYVDKPYPVEKRVPYPVEKIVEKKVPYPVHVPVEVKVPYPVDRIVEKPVHVPIKVPYAVEKYIDRPYPVYGYGYSHVSQTHNLPQYTKYVQNSLDLQRQASTQNYLKKRQQQNFDQQKESSNQNYVQNQQIQPNAQNLKQKQINPVYTTHWGNQYAASFDYVNASQHANDVKRSLVDYLNKMNYYGPPPPQNYDDWWEKNKNYVVEMKVRRTDRTPKVTKLRIEYGGFKPPLIPSTEVDLDGIPVNKNLPQS